MFERPIVNKIVSRFQEPYIQILFGARQVGKTTLIQQALKKTTSPHYYIIAEAATHRLGLSNSGLLHDP